MSAVKSRIQNNGKMDLIKVSKAEADVYDGSGWKLARFSNGLLTGFFDPLDMPYQEDLQAAADAAKDAATVYIANAERDGAETWLVMCSCYELCLPRRVSLKSPDAGAWAAMATRFTDALEI